MKNKFKIENYSKDRLVIARVGDTRGRVASKSGGFVVRLFDEETVNRLVEVCGKDVEKPGNKMMFWKKKK